MTAEQERAYFDACGDFRFPVFFTLAYTGLSVGELTHPLIDRDIGSDVGALQVTRRIELNQLTCHKDLRHLFAMSLQVTGVDLMVRCDLARYRALEITSRSAHATHQTRCKGFDD